MMRDEGQPCPRGIPFPPHRYREKNDRWALASSRARNALISVLYVMVWLKIANRFSI